MVSSRPVNNKNESLMTKLAKAVFACGDQNSNPFASTSLDSDTIWEASDLSVMDLADRYDMIEKQRQDNICEYSDFTSDNSVFSDRRRQDRRDYRKRIHVTEARR